jgi:hypothetical protein
MASTNSSTPTPEDVMLNLDTLEREQVRGVPKPKAKPYSTMFLGKRIIFEDPLEIASPVLMRMEETPERFFRAALSDADFQHMMSNFDELPGWKLQALMQGYQDYYGLDGQGNARGSRR